MSFYNNGICYGYLRDHTSHQEKGFISVVAEERLGYYARAAYVEASMHDWRRVMHAHTEQAGASSTPDAAMPPSCRRPRTRPSPTSMTSTPRSASFSSRGRTPPYPTPPHPSLFLRQLLALDMWVHPSVQRCVHCGACVCV
jgi:hypothetical protein